MPKKDFICLGLGLLFDFEVTGVTIFLKVWVFEVCIAVGEGRFSLGGVAPRLDHVVKLIKEPAGFADQNFRLEDVAHVQVVPNRQVRSGSGFTAARKNNQYQH